MKHPEAGPTVCGEPDPDDVDYWCIAPPHDDSRRHIWGRDYLVGRTPKILDKLAEELDDA